jgi:hypothetical protein
VLALIFTELLLHALPTGPAVFLEICLPHSGAPPRIRSASIVDGNEAAAAVAFRLSEVMVIYPITRSSPLGEWSELWNSEKKKNIGGAIPDVIQMQSDGRAAGAHAPVLV